MSTGESGHSRQCARCPRQPATAAAGSAAVGGSSVSGLRSAECALAVDFLAVAVLIAVEFDLIGKWCHLLDIVLSMVAAGYGEGVGGRGRER